VKKLQQRAEPTVYEEWTAGADGEMQVEIKENV
jgi:hypothetical protein